MGLHEHILAFRGVKRIAESFDPTDVEATYPDITKAATDFKKASQATDALRAQGDDSGVQKQLWQAHREKKEAHAALLGRTLLDFPHLSIEDALCVAGRHIKRGNMQPFEHLAVLSDFYGARDHNEHGVTFNTPYRKTRADVFLRCLKLHYPQMQVVTKDMPIEGLLVVQFPDGEHIPPQQTEDPQDEVPQEEPPPEQAQPQEPQPAPPAPPAQEPVDQAAAAEAISNRPFQVFRTESSDRQRSWDKVTRLYHEAEALRAKATAAYYRRDTMKQQIMTEADEARDAAKQAEQAHASKFDRYWR